MLIRNELGFQKILDAPKSPLYQSAFIKDCEETQRNLSREIESYLHFRNASKITGENTCKERLLVGRGGLQVSTGQATFS